MLSFEKNRTSYLLWLHWRQPCENCCWEREREACKLRKNCNISIFTSKNNIFIEVDSFFFFHYVCVFVESDWGSDHLEMSVWPCGNVRTPIYTTVLGSSLGHAREMRTDSEGFSPGTSVFLHQQQLIKSHIIPSDRGVLPRGHIAIVIKWCILLFVFKKSSMVCPCTEFSLLKGD